MVDVFDPNKVKLDFPILSRKVNGKSLVYLDSGATSQKPKAVIDSITEYYEKHNAGAHRGAHSLGDEATEMLEGARKTLVRFIGAGSEKEVVFVKNTTEGINLVAHGWGLGNLSKDDVVLTTEMEHHADVVPWQQVAGRVGAKVEYVKVSSDGLLDLSDFESKLSDRVRVVAVTHVSNSLGTINPIREIVKMSRKVGALVLVDGAQAVPHMRVDVGNLGCDFYTFSGHKMLGPLGSGVLWGKRELLESMNPLITGGGMISEVRKDGSSWAVLPDKFEAGVPDVASISGMAVAAEYLEKLGTDNVRKHDLEVVEYCLEKLGDVEEVEILGPLDAEKRSGSVSFVYKGVHAHDVATVLDSEGVAVRSGHHCTMILHREMNVTASVRASFNVYTTRGDIDRLVDGLGKVKEVFGK